MQTTTSFGSFLVATLCASFASGAVLPQSDSGAGSFQVRRQFNANFNGRNGPLALARGYNKYGIEPPQELLQAVETVKALNANAIMKRDAGNATATPDTDDLEYLVPVQIGTPAQTLNLDFDTGSSDLWVFSSETSGSVDSHSLYKPDGSSSSKKLDGATWSIQYGDGSTSSGDVYTDIVKVGDLTFETQAVESAKKVSQQFAEGKSDGLLGLGFSSINTVQPKPQKTWFDNMAAGGLDKALFVADLRHDEPGSYWFGAIPEDATEPAYAPIDSSQGWWQFDTKLEGASDASPAIADTGTTLIMIDAAIVKAYYAKVDGAKNDSQLGGYVFACDTELPDFTFTVGDVDFKVPGKLINYAPASANSDQCFGGIQGNQGVGINILGDIALKAAYVIFDQENNQIGWAAK